MPFINIVLLYKSIKTLGKNPKKASYKKYFFKFLEMSSTTDTKMFSHSTFDM